MTKEEREGVYKKAYQCGYSQGLEQGKTKTIERACRWLKENMPLGWDTENGKECELIDITEFREALNGRRCNR